MVWYQIYNAYSTITWIIDAPLLHQISMCKYMWSPLLWRHNGRGSVSNHQPHHCLLNRLFRRRSKKTSKLRVTGGAGEFPAQIARNAENVSNWWRHHEMVTNVNVSKRWSEDVKQTRMQLTVVQETVYCRSLRGPIYIYDNNSYVYVYSKSYVALNHRLCRTWYILHVTFTTSATQDYAVLCSWW